MSTDAANIIDIRQARKQKNIKKIVHSRIQTGEDFEEYIRLQEPTGERLDDLESRFKAMEDFQIITKTKEISNEGKASPENIYQVIGSSSEKDENTPTILKIKRLLKEGLEHLK